jgi:hypothetical protein
MPVAGAIAMNIGCSPMTLIGTKSRGTSIGMLGAAPRIVTKAEEAAWKSV